MSRHIPFEAIRAASLRQAQYLLAEWFPNGRRIGSEFKIGNIQGDPGESLSISLATGKWADFAGSDSGHDLIELRARITGTERVTAARELATMLGIPINGQAGPAQAKPNGQDKAAKDDWQQMIPVPADAPPPNGKFYGYGTVHEYRGLKDELLFYVRRREATATERKQFHPLVYGTLNGQTGWHSKHPAVPKPLYKLDRLAALPDAPVLLCEGEKACDAAATLFQDHACSWCGGAKAARHADTTPLASRDVIIWPDADAEGAAAAMELRKKLPRARVLRVDDLPNGHDAADITPDDPAAWLREHLPPAEQASEPPPEPDPADAPATAEELSYDDFYAYMPAHSYIYVPARTPWPAPSVNARLEPRPLLDKKGKPVLSKGAEVMLAPAAWLDRYRPVEQTTWAPGLPMVIKNKLIMEGGWVQRKGVSVFNLYQAPEIAPGDPAKAGKWLEHVHYIYPEEADHIVSWLAHRVQRPQEKINHALVLGGDQGIGKDSLLEPVKYAIGHWNFQEASPQQILGRFNGFLKSVILRVSEARDLGEFDRFAFYDHMKTITASPPDTLRIDEKHLREYAIINCCGVIITTNHKNDGIFLSPDDRRHFVAWSSRTKEDARFQGGYWNDLWSYYHADGLRHVATFLRQHDIRDFDPKAPPPKTTAFWSIVNSNRPSEEAELRDAIERLGTPEALTLQDLLGCVALGSNGVASNGLYDWLNDRKNRRVIPHRLNDCGYVSVQNPDAKDGLWKIAGRRQVVYSKVELAPTDQIRAARGLK